MSSIKSLEDCYESMLKCGIDDGNCKQIDNGCYVSKSTYFYADGINEEIEEHPIMKIKFADPELSEENTMQVFCYSKRLTEFYINPQPNINKDLLDENINYREGSNFAYVLSYSLFVTHNLEYAIENIQYLIKSAKIAKLCLPNYIIRLYVETQTINKEFEKRNEFDVLLLELIKVGNVEIFQVVANGFTYNENMQLKSALDEKTLTYSRNTRFLSFLDDRVGLTICKDIDSRLTLLECYNIKLFEKSDKLIYKIKFVDNKLIDKKFISYGGWIKRYKLMLRENNDTEMIEYINKMDYELLAGTTGIKFGINMLYYTTKHIKIYKNIGKLINSNISFTVRYKDLTTNTDHERKFLFNDENSSDDLSYTALYDWANSITKPIKVVREDINDLVINYREYNENKKVFNFGTDEILLLELFTKYSTESNIFAVGYDDSIILKLKIPETYIFFMNRFDHDYDNHYSKCIEHSQELMNILKTVSNNKPVYNIISFFNKQYQNPELSVTSYVIFSLMDTINNSKIEHPNTSKNLPNIKFIKINNYVVSLHDIYKLFKNITNYFNGYDKFIAKQKFSNDVNMEFRRFMINICNRYIDKNDNMALETFDYAFSYIDSDKKFIIHKSEADVRGIDESAIFTIPITSFDSFLLWQMLFNNIIFDFERIILNSLHIFDVKLDIFLYDSEYLQQYDQRLEKFGFKI